MSAETTLPQTPSNGDEARPAGVRTYRGRTLEEIIPKIRDELGADAIILREREGLVGGLGGFFAQRFIEVDARPGGPSIDIYDEDDDEPALPPPAFDEAEFLDEPFVVPEPEPEPVIAIEPALAPEPEPEPEPAPVLDVEPEPVSTTASDAFVRQLQQAAAAWTEDDARIRELPERTGVTDVEPREPLQEAPIQEAQIEEPALPEPVVVQPPPPVVVAPPPVAPAPAPVVSMPALPPPAPAAAPRIRRRDRIREALAARSGGRLRPVRVGRTQPNALDRTEAKEIAIELMSHGASEAWVAQLIAEAAAHRTALTPSHNLRDAVRSVLARGILHAPPLPLGGSAIAFVGAGGGGKTRCAAAMATAYRRASTLSVSVISLRSADAGRELTDLLRSAQVPVQAAGTARAATRTVQSVRSGGLVIVDTPATTPGDPAATAALAAELEPFALDAVYVTLPATVSSQAARKLLASLGPLRPTAIAITHADETDQLGVAVEIAATNRIPVAYIHGGTDLNTSLTALDPLEVAHKLLP